MSKYQGPPKTFRVLKSPKQFGHMAENVSTIVTMFPITECNCGRMFDLLIPHREHSEETFLFAIFVMGYLSSQGFSPDKVMNRVSEQLESGLHAYEAIGDILADHMYHRDAKSFMDTLIGMVTPSDAAKSAMYELGMVVAGVEQLSCQTEQSNEACGHDSTHDVKCTSPRCVNGRIDGTGRECDWH